MVRWDDRVGVLMIAKMRYCQSCPVQLSVSLGLSRCKCRADHSWAGWCWITRWRLRSDLFCPFLPAGHVRVGARTRGRLPPNSVTKGPMIILALAWSESGYWGVQNSQYPCMDFAHNLFFSTPPYMWACQGPMESWKLLYFWEKWVNHPLPPLSRLFWRDITEDEGQGRTWGTNSPYFLLNLWI